MAQFEASKASDKDILKLVLWMQYQKQYSGNNYKEISDFVKANPSWPAIKRLNNNAEEALNNLIPARTIISYFTDKQPVTGHGMIVLAEAKVQQNGSTAEINKLLSQGWIQGDFTKEEESDILVKYGHRLRTEDHAARLDRLLWEDKIVQAKRLIGKIDNARQNLFLARIRLMEGKKGMEGPIDSSLKDDPGLIYLKAKWYEDRDDYAHAYELLSRIRGTMPYQEKWWKLKNTLIRGFLKEKNYEAAYSLTGNHGNQPGTEDYSESEWLAGWISIEFLKNPQQAYGHFENLYNGVLFPVSKSRGAYWAARAAEQTGQAELSRKWYGIAAEHLTTFYGQLAYVKLNPKGNVNIPDVAISNEIRNNVYKNNELLKLAYLLDSVGESKTAETFIIAAINSASSPAEMSVISEIGKNTKKIQLSVLAAKHALRKGVILSKAGWPIIENLPASDVEKPLVLGLIRQESSFDAGAKSPSNALGLMQLLPSTAKEVSKKAGLNYHVNRLGEPIYNITLGSQYLGQLINRFDGSYVLAIASYNAGASNARKWINTYGDPRQLTSPLAVISWIESIPFSETRSYVQRVLENTEVYRNKLNGSTFTLKNDLLRGRTQLSDESVTNDPQI
jgi:soluble lytic murein transglycosylase